MMGRMRTGLSGRGRKRDVTTFLGRRPFSKADQPSAQPVQPAVFGTPDAARRRDC
jgi:hypothetical protein